MASQSLSGLLSTSGKTKPPKVKQACDCCHVRKIRCDGALVQPCNNCRIANLSCTYYTIPKKKGPKGPSRKTPRTILKMQMQMQHENSRAPEIKAHERPIITPSASSSSPSDIVSSFEPSNSPFLPSPLLSLEVAEQYIEIFFKYKYAVTPFLHRERLYARLTSLYQSPDTYALVASLCASMIGQLQSDQPVVTSSDLPFDATISKAEFFVSEAKRARSFREYVEKPTISDIHTSFFLFSTMFNLGRHNSAWFYLREAMTMSQLLRLEHEETYLEMDEIDAIFTRRTFWLLFISERYAMSKSRLMDSMSNSPIEDMLFKNIDL